MAAGFRGGRNIAMKVPPHQYEAVLAFYRDTLGLAPLDSPNGIDVGFEFGPVRLWIDRAPAQSQAEIWLEVVADDTAEAARRLSDAGIARCDEIEELGAGFDGFWIANPAGIVHLVSGSREGPG